METQKNINYAEELAKLVESNTQNIWKAKQGKHKVEILREPEDSKFTRDNGETTDQWKLHVKVNGEEKTWFIGKSNAKNSIRGQLIKLATMKGGKLTGVNFDLLVVGDGKDKKYTIPETL